MTELAVETSALSKVYGVRTRVVAVEDLDLRVERGGIHGLLGPDGAGKTVVLRMLLALVQPSAGSVQVLGNALDEEALDRVGGVVDEQGFTPHMTVRRNLGLLAGLTGVPDERVDEVIERVGLGDLAKVKVGFLSDGEEQRLGIASALLKAPELLVLDEPTTGLSPDEARSVTELVRELAEDGITVLLSSQDLAEVQALCRTVAIMLDGRLLAAGAVSELLGEDTSRTRVHVHNPRRALRRLREAGYTAHREGPGLIVEGHDHPEEITRVLAEESLFVEELSVIRPDLQSFFSRLDEQNNPVLLDDAAATPKGGKRKKSRK